MGNGLTANAVRQIARVFRDGTLVGMSDRQILERFVESHDETAFEAILTRHGPMVRRVCQQMLFNSHDVDDAVQAVFLALVRKAKTIRIEDSLGPWLYTVAGRVAARARSKRRKQRARESFEDTPPEASYSSTAGNSEIPVIIHDELRRLPERLRAPLILCYLEGLTHDMAAHQLDCPVGTVRSRLARARGLLHTRITRRGLTLTATAVCAALESNAATAASTHLPAAVQMLPRNGMGLSSSFAMILEGVLNVLPVKKVAVLATAISVGTIAFAVVERTTVGQTPQPKSQASPSPDGPRPHDLTGEQISVLPRLETKKDPHVLAIEAKLKERVSVDFQNQPLREAVAFLQNDSGLNIVLDPKALREERLTSSSPVSLTAKQVPIKSVLKLMLKPLGLTYTIVDEVVLITNPHADGLDGRLVDSTPANEGTKLYRKTYYVGDLIKLGERITVTAGRQGAGVSIGPVPDVGPLIRLIEATVAPGTWMIPDQQGQMVPTKVKGRVPARADEMGSITPFFLSVSLIVNCKLEVHDDLATLLRGLRDLMYSRDEVETEEHSGADPVSRPGDQPATQTQDSAKTGVPTTPDVDVTVSESKRVISPQGTTTFEIRVANHGTGEATNLRLAVNLSPNLNFHGLVGGPNGVNVAVNGKKDIIMFDQIPTLAPGKVMVFAIKALALSAKPKLATCKATVAHDGLTEELEDMACVKVTTRMPQDVAQKRESSKTRD
jgi:RNA polymerase sigma factor (sigma-70 family)